MRARSGSQEEGAGAVRYGWVGRERRWIGTFGVKSMSPTHKLHSRLSVLSGVEVDGMPGGAVECVEIGRNTSGEGGRLGTNGR